MASLYDIEVRTLEGEAATLAAHRGKVMLVVNVASRCGYTPQYRGLQHLHENYADRGFAVIGFPCNQFLGQEPGTPEEIREFCSREYGVTFPLYEKVDVNGDDRHAIYEVLTTTPDGDGDAGDVRWNFEKFLVDAAGTPAKRFRSDVTPKDPVLVQAIEALLARKEAADEDAG